MPLEISQIRALSEVFHTEFSSVEELVLFAAEFNYNLLNEAPEGKTSYRAFIFLNYLNNTNRHKDLLNRLKASEYPLLKAKAEELLSQPDIAASEEAGESADEAKYSALLPGGNPFLGRDDLRTEIKKFACRKDASVNADKRTRVLVVTGKEPCGKSYTYTFLQFLAEQVAEAEITLPLSLPLQKTTKGFFESVGNVLGVQPTEANGFPDLKDEPQETRLNRYLKWLEGYVAGFEKPKWLIIDDINHGVTPEAREAAHAVAEVAEGKSGSKLWVALLGYNHPITSSVLEKAIIEEARFPSCKAVAEFFVNRAQAGKQKVEMAEARHWAEILIGEETTLNKESMDHLKKAVVNMGLFLSKGILPNSESIAEYLLSRANAGVQEIELEEAGQWADILIGDETLLDKESLKLVIQAVIDFGDLLHMGILPNAESIANYFVKQAQEGGVEPDADVAQQAAALLLEQTGGINRDSMETLKKKIIDLGKSFSEGFVVPAA